MTKTTDKPGGSWKTNSNYYVVIIQTTDQGNEGRGQLNRSLHIRGQLNRSLPTYRCSQSSFLCNSRSHFGLFPYQKPEFFRYGNKLVKQCKPSLSSEKPFSIERIFSRRNDNLIFFFEIFHHKFEWKFILDKIWNN